MPQVTNPLFAPTPHHTSQPQVESKYIVRINYGIGANPRYDTQYFESLNEVRDYMDRPTSAKNAQSYLAGNIGIEVFELSPVIVLRA